MTRDEAQRLLVAHRWPDGLDGVMRRLRADGHAAWLVGGTVRDVLLRRGGGERVDVATDRTPEAVTALFAHVVPTGLRHGTVTVIEDGLEIEVTTFRLESDYSDARRPDAVTFTRDLEGDLARRDLTVNALAFDPVDGVLVDPHGGIEDLVRGLLRAVGDPVDRFREDGLRPLRAARLAATLEMEIEPVTRAALGAAMDRARLVSWERVGEELSRMMTAPRPSVGWNLLRDAGLLALWMPELQRCVGVPQNRWHAFDVYEHSVRACDAAPRERSRVRWAALLHDIGKPDTRVERGEDEASFYGHETVGAAKTMVLLERLRFPLAERDAIIRLVRDHMFEYRAEWTDAAVRRWLRRVTPEAVEDLFALRQADAAAKSTEGRSEDVNAAFRARIAEILQASHVLERTQLAIGGTDVMEVLQMSPGPEVGRVLEELLNQVLEHPALNNREVLIAMLERRRSSRG
jgi:tRNA nucleotidyltransferase (CCA-adding enzyme)